MCQKITYLIGQEFRLINDDAFLSLSSGFSSEFQLRVLLQEFIYSFAKKWICKNLSVFSWWIFTEKLNSAIFVAQNDDSHTQPKLCPLSHKHDVFGHIFFDKKCLIWNASNGVYNLKCVNIFEIPFILTLLCVTIV